MAITTQPTTNEAMRLHCPFQAFDVLSDGVVIGVIRCADLPQNQTDQSQWFGQAGAPAVGKGAALGPFASADLAAATVAQVAGA